MWLETHIIFIRIGKNWVFDTFKIIVKAIVYRYMQAKNQSVSVLNKSSRRKKTNAQERTSWIISISYSLSAKIGEINWWHFVEKNATEPSLKHNLFVLKFKIKLKREMKHSVYWLSNTSGIAQLCPTLCDPMDCSLPGSSIHGIFQTRVLKWVAISFSRGSSQPKNKTQVSYIADRHFTLSATL